MRIEKFWRKKFSSKRENSFGSISDLRRKCFTFLSERIRRLLQHCILSVHRNILKENNFFEKFVFLIVCGHWLKKFYLLLIIFSRRCQDYILVVQRNIFGEQTEKKSFFIIIELWATIFWLSFDQLPTE